MDESLWAKSRGLDPALPPYPLVRHLVDTAAMALHVWDVYLSEGQRGSIGRGLGVAGEPERARSLVGLCAGLHDIGKISGFQFCSRHGRDHLGARFGPDRREMETDRLGHDVAGMEAAAEVLEILGFVPGSAAIDRTAETADTGCRRQLSMAAVQAVRRVFPARTPDWLSVNCSRQHLVFVGTVQAAVGGHVLLRWHFVTGLLERVVPGYGADRRGGADWPEPGSWAALGTIWGPHGVPCGDR
ncbi:HD domain-containing protein [Streptomyces sp. NPDC020875]|uniref:HD domain-containing protein n=1 Tax=Streptomyces sp. NPDC020875 TaxID=3154898 RepID=UPI00340D558E